MKKTVGVCIAIAVCALTSSAFAESPDEADAESSAAQALLQRADQDGDGRVSYREFSKLVRESVDKQVAKRFRQLDRNGDGRCTRAEVNKMDATRFARFDLNHDGAFTQAELTRVIERQLSPRLVQLHNALDRDGDGSLSVAELTRSSKATITASVGSS